MTHALPPLIAALLNPALYPEPAAQVELIETHASWVLVAGDFVYKIKKPINIPFVDYSTLARRRFCCLEELRLNRRYAPELYLGLVEISGAPGAPVLGALNADTGSGFEYAVKMKRFEEAGRLDHLSRNGKLTPEHIAGLVAAVIHFHNSAAVAPVNSPFGGLESVGAPALENITALQSMMADAGDQQRLASLLSWTQAVFARLSPLLMQRQAAGFIRECHGDLHLRNLVLIGERVTLFDCIEFNEEFRWIDVASEIAFTYVDLLDHRQPGLASWLLSQWLMGTGDYTAVPLLRFYAVYRALVRAKVAGILALQTQGDFTAARTYLTLAQQLTALARPSLSICHGLSGSGKTTAAKRRLLADAGGATLWVRSDVERKRLLGLAANAQTGSPLSGGIYSLEANQLTYQRLFELAEQMLADGWSVIVDAAFLRKAERDHFMQLAATQGRDFFILAPQASMAELTARIAQRLALEQDASEATLEVLQRQQAFIEPLTDDEKVYLVAV